MSTSASPQSLGRKLRFAQLLVFEQVLRSRSILHASRELNLTQSAVTKIVHELEDYFGASLLVRGNRGVAPTELGELVARRAKSMLAELRHLSGEVGAFHEGAAGQVFVGTLISGAAELLPRAIRILKARAPAVVVTLRVGQTDQLFPALSVGDLDLVVARIPEDGSWRKASPQLDVRLLYREQLCLVAGAGHPLACSRSVSIGALHDLPWILPTRDSSLRQTADALFFDAGLAPPANIVESLSVQTNIALMADGRTVGLMPHSAARQLADFGAIRILPLLQLPAFGNIGCFSHSARNPAPAVGLFEACLREAAAELDGAGEAVRMRS